MVLGFPATARTGAHTADGRALGLGQHSEAGAACRRPADSPVRVQAGRQREWHWRGFDSAACLPGSLLSRLRAVVLADSALCPHGHMEVLIRLWPDHSVVPWGGLQTAPTFACPVPSRPRSHHKARHFSPTEGRFSTARSGRDAHGNRGRASQPQPPGWWGPRTWSPEGDALLLMQRDWR